MSYQCQDRTSCAFIYTHDNCDLDYFGPMMVKVGRRREKLWGVIFTCLTVRAFHLELACSISTDLAIMAIRRMTCRIGSLSVIWSDNALNLRAADAELNKAISKLDQQSMQGEVTNEGIE